MCKLCDSGQEETLNHFLVDCNYYQQVRLDYNVHNMTLAEILLFAGNSSSESSKIFLGIIWKMREIGLKRLVEP